jgi:hypothetical protein
VADSSDSFNLKTEAGGFQAEAGDKFSKTSGSISFQLSPSLKGIS